MKKEKTEMSWDLDPVKDNTNETPAPTATQEVSPAKPDVPKQRRIIRKANQYDMEGLQTDFPTAKELERFVYDRTGYILNLKGLANAVKYQIAMDTLNGIEPDEDFLTHENPYLEKTELVPQDPFTDAPAPDPAIARAGPVGFKFDTRVFPHPDPEWRAQDQKAHVCFKKYANGIITYEIIGPIAQRPVGLKVNKFGQKVPERYTWVDPRTGEQIIKNTDGSYTPLGTRLRAFMRRQRMNNSNFWDVWIDREFVAGDEIINDNPWQTE